MSYAEVKTREEARERIKYLEERSREKLEASVSAGYVELTKIENTLFSWRKEINSLKNKFNV
jgi:hypothetical protein